MPAQNKHHLLYQSRMWSEGKLTKKLRERLTVRVDVEPHNELHAQLRAVPSPSSVAIRAMYETIVSVPDSVKRDRHKRDVFCVDFTNKLSASEICELLISIARATDYRYFGRETTATKKFIKAMQTQRELLSD